MKYEKEEGKEKGKGQQVKIKNVKTFLLFLSFYLWNFRKTEI